MTILLLLRVIIPIHSESIMWTTLCYMPIWSLLKRRKKTLPGMYYHLRMRKHREAKEVAQGHFVGCGGVRIFPFPEAASTNRSRSQACTTPGNSWPGVAVRRQGGQWRNRTMTNPSPSSQHRRKPFLCFTSYWLPKVIRLSWLLTPQMDSVCFCTSYKEITQHVRLCLPAFT